MVAAHRKNELAMLSMELGRMTRYLTTEQLITAKQEFAKILTKKAQSKLNSLGNRNDEQNKS